MQADMSGSGRFAYRKIPKAHLRRKAWKTQKQESWFALAATHPSLGRWMPRNQGGGIGLKLTVFGMIFCFCGQKVVAGVVYRQNFTKTLPFLYRFFILRGKNRSKTDRFWYDFSICPENRSKTDRKWYEFRILLS
jgi:hypothetical protein